METPETRYARSGDVHIAYQVVGSGPLDLVVIPGWVSHVEHAWEVPSYASFLRRLATFARVIFLDRRGTGLSDPVDRLPTLEERVEDLRAVLRAAGSERAAIFGISEGGQMSMLYAATHPDATHALVLYGTFAEGATIPGHLGRHFPDSTGDLAEDVARFWGQGAATRVLAPSRAGDAEFVRQWAKMERMAASPGAIRAILAMAFDADVRAVLPTIRVPTLVLAREDDAVVPAGETRKLAEQIPGARYEELPGADHLAWTGDVDALLGRVEEFLTGVRRAPSPDRVLATVLFADIAGSTERAAELGDRAWRDVLERFHAAAAGSVAAEAGSVVDTAGDGLLARFEGPARAVRAAAAMRAAAQRLGLPVRCGIHTGECERMGEKIAGIAVHIGARVAEAARPGEILVSGTVRDLVVGSDLRFRDRGSRSLSGVPGDWRLYEVTS